MVIVENNLELRFSDYRDHEGRRQGDTQYVSNVVGTLVIQPDRAELDYCRQLLKEDHPDEEITDERAVTLFVEDLPETDVLDFGVRVLSWYLIKVVGQKATLEVKSFEGGDNI